MINVALRGVILAALLGLALGWIVARALRAADKSGWVEEHSLLGMSVALSLAAVTLARLLGSDGILGAFAAGAAFAITSDRRENYEDENVQEAISKLFTFPVFVLFGVMLPVMAWQGQI